MHTASHTAPPLLLNELEGVPEPVARRLKVRDDAVAELARTLEALADTIGSRLEAALSGAPDGVTEFERSLVGLKNADQLRVAVLAAEFRQLEELVDDAGLDIAAERWFSRYSQMANNAEQTLGRLGVPQADQLLDEPAIIAATEAMVERHDAALFGGIRQASAVRIVEGLHAGAGLRTATEVANDIAVAERVGFERATVEAETRIAEADRYFIDHAIKSAEDADNGITFLLAYVGPVDGRKRPFCAALVGKAFKREEIEPLRNGQTVTHPIHSCGGYRCRDSWQPTMEELLEDSPYVRGTSADISAANAAAHRGRKKRKR